MIERVEERFEIMPDRLVGDTNYGSAAMLGWLVDEKKIAPHTHVADKSERDDGTLSRSDFQWDEQANEYRCPEGKALRSDWRTFKKPRDRITKADTILYHSSKPDCATCPNKSRCCPNTPVRKIARSIHEKARDIARAIGQNGCLQGIMQTTKEGGDAVCASEAHPENGQLRLRGFSGAQDEFLLAATAQNLRRMAKWLAPEAPKGELTPV